MRTLQSLILTLGLFLLGACRIGVYPITPEIAEAGSYIVYNEIGTGTAWAVDDHNLVTAGHICEQISENVILVSTAGRRFHGKIVFWDQARSYASDLCLIHTDYKLPYPMNIASRMPKEGEAMGYAGFPEGVFGVYEGVYLGDMDGPTCSEQDHSFTAWTNHGASGSAVYTNRGVWGVLVRLRVDCATKQILPPDRGGVAIPLEILRDFLDDADVNYTVTPDQIEKPSI